MWAPVLLALMIVAPLSAQQARQVIISLSERKFKDGAQHLSSTAQVVPLTVDLRAFRSAAARPGELRLASVPLSRGLKVDLDLEEFNVLAHDAELIVTTSSGVEPLARPTARLYRGKVAGEEKSFAYLSISDHFVLGSVTTSGKTYQISTDYTAPSSATRIEANAYPLADANIPDAGCGVNGHNLPSLDPTPMTMEEIEHMSAAPPPQAGEILYSVKGAFDGDVEYVQLLGGRQQAQDYMMQVIGNVSAIFERDVKCQIAIARINLYETGAHPYPYTEAASMDAALFQANGFWNGDPVMRNVDRAFVHVFSGKPWQNPIGIAFLDGLCKKGEATGYSAITKTNPERDLMVVSHENGHIFGSKHTHSCSWSPEIDRCANAEDGGCFGAGQVTQSLGTIMSYCAQHELVFHEKCANLIMNNLQNRYKCVEFSSRLTINPAYVYFPALLVDKPRDTTITAFYQNNSKQPVEVLTQTLAGDNVSALTVVSPTPPFTLQPGESKDLVLHVESDEETPMIVNMTITHNALNPPVVAVIEGYAQDKQPILGLLAGGKKEIDFGIHRVGARVDTLMKNFYANNGEAPLRATKVEIIGPDRFDFQVVEGTGPFEIETGAPRLSARIRFSPQSTGDKQAWLRVESNSENGTDSVLLKGHVKVGPLLRMSANDLSINFRERLKKVSYDTIFTEFFTNAGSDTLQVIADLEGEDKNAFTVYVNSIDLAPGETYDMKVTLFDSTEGFKKAFLVINQIETEGPSIYRRDTLWLIAQIGAPASVAEEVSATTGFTVSPNPTPANAEIAITPLAGEIGLNYTLTVTDAAGRSVRQFSDRFTREGASIALETDGLPAGTYFLSLRTAKGQRMQTLTLTR
jgi:Metallo-peptidase family M12